MSSRKVSRVVFTTKRLKENRKSHIVISMFVATMLIHILMNILKFEYSWLLMLITIFVMLVYLLSHMLSIQTIPQQTARVFPVDRDCIVVPYKK